MKPTNRKISFIIFFLSIITNASAVLSYRDVRSQIGLGPQTIFWDHSIIGFGGYYKYALSDTSSPNNYIGGSLSIFRDRADFIGGGHRVSQTEIYLSADYNYYFFEMMSGHFRPFVGLSAGNLFMINDGPASSSDSFNPFLKFGIGADLIFTKNFGLDLSLAYVPVWGMGDSLSSGPFAPVGTSLMSHWHPKQNDGDRVDQFHLGLNLNFAF